ncbi:MAG TPA: flagellar motor switch protein FliG [Acidisarcina sp.]
MSEEAAAAALDLPGIRKAAILLVSLGVDSAAVLFRHLSEEDLQRLAEEVSSMGAVAPEVSLKVLEEYQRMTSAQDYDAQGGHEFARRLLVKAFGEAGAETLLASLTKAHQQRAGRVESLQKADPQQLARFLEEEHPQTVALILGHLNDKQGSALLMNLPHTTRAQVVQRLANLRRFSPEVAEKVSTALNLRLKSVADQGRRNYSGSQNVADLMNCIDSSASSEILHAIEVKDPDLAIGIRDLMFTFEDFIGVADNQIRELMGLLDKKALCIALKGANEEMRDHFFRTMSSRAVEMMREDMEALGPVRGKDVMRAQAEIVSIARKLESEGKIILKGDGGDEYV